MTAGDLFRLTGLRPFGKYPSSDGSCSCQPNLPTTIYKRGSGQGAIFQCDVCIALSQAYLNPPPKSVSRLVDGSYMLITTERIEFWGNHLLRKINPKIIRNAATSMRQVKKRLIIDPPEPPWLFISFSKAPVTGAHLRMTEDNNLLRFSGKTTLGDSEVHDLNREQVMQMVQIGMSDREWRAYLDAYAASTQAGLRVMQDMMTKYPALEDLRCLPPLDSPEHNALKLLLSKDEPDGV